MTDRLEFTVVAAAPDGVSGSILASVLESAGIPVEVRGRGSSWLFPHAAGGLGMVQVLVPREYVDEAKELLAARLDELPADKEPVVVAEVKDGGAGFLAAALRSAGIPAIVRPSRYSGASGSVLVPPDLVDDAKEVIAALEQAASDEEPGADEDEALGPADDEVLEPEDDELAPDEDEDEPEAEELDPDEDEGPGEDDVPGPGDVDTGVPDSGPDGPPAYGSDLRPDFGDGPGPGGNGAGR